MVTSGLRAFVCKRLSVLASLLQTSAIVGVGLGLVPSGNAYAQTVTWDSDPTTVNIQSGDGVWDIGTTQNWTTDGGGTNTTFADTNDVIFGATAVGPTVTLDLQVVPNSILFNGDNYTISGTGTIGDGSAPVSITVNAGFTATLATDLTGIFLLGGAGTLNYSGTTTTVTQMDIASGSTLVNTGNLSGTVQNNGTLTNIGSLTEDVANTGTLTSTGTIDGTVTNNGTANLEGVVTGGVDNTNTGTVAITGNTQVNGSFTNNNSVTQLTGSDLTLAVGGTFTNNATVDAGASGSLSVTAGTIVLGTASVLNGDVRLTGGIINDGTINYTVDTDLNGSMTNNTTGSILVDATVTSNGSFFSNSGGVDVTNNGTLTGISALTNSGVVNVAAGGTISAATMTNLAGGTLTNGGTLTGDITNNTGGTLVSTGTVDGTVTNNGTLTTEGTISGDLNQLGGALTISNDLAVGGTFNNDSNIGTVTPNLTVGALDNSGTMVVQGNLTSTGGVLANTGSGNLTLAGTTTGNVTSGAGATLVLTGNLTGNLTTSGTTSLENQITGGLTILGGQTDLTGNLAVGGAVNNSGALVLDLGETLTAAGNVANGGTLTNAGTVVGNVTNTGGLTSTGTINGTVTNDGTANLEGAVTGGVSNSTGSTLTATGNLTTNTLANSGTMTVAAGTTTNVTTSPVTNAGTLTVNGTLGADVTNSGTLVNTGNVGSVTNTGTLTSAGTIGGNVTNNGTANLAGTVVGGMTNTNGSTLTATGDLTANSLANDGMMTVAAGTTTNITTSPVTNAGTLTVNGTLGADVNNLGSVVLNNGLNGSLTSIGNAVIGGTITGNFDYLGGPLTLGGNVTVNGNFTSSADFGIMSGQTITANTFTNNTDTTLSLAGTLVATNAQNNGIIDASSGANITTAITNNGLINTSGNLTFGANLVNNGTIDMGGNATAGDIVNVAGDMIGNGGTFNIDLDLGSGVTDMVTVAGTASGHYVLNFNIIGTPTDPPVRDFLVVDVNGFSGPNQYQVVNLPFGSERIIYTGSQLPSGDFHVIGQLNPGVGSLSGSVTLTQSLIGAVINRPSSPFVVGLAYEEKEKPCGIGGWARAIGGYADASGTTANGTSVLGSEISANYAGLQFGGDLACFDGHYNGWDLAFGGIGGVNTGTTQQPVYAVDVADPNLLTSTLTSVTTTDFDQKYLGLYLAAAKGPFSADLQYRRERTDFVLNNIPAAVGFSGLGLTDVPLETNADTFSGSLSYAFKLKGEGWGFIPTAGFAYSQIKSDLITFDDGATLQIKDSSSRYVFAGATLSKMTFGKAGDSALTRFITATIYQDLSPDTESVYTGINGAIDNLSSSSLGSYQELSVGLNYIKVLNSGSARAARQFNASVRVDARFSSTLNSAGLTAQVRWQF